mgnify:CR=1 FL=1
MNSGRVTLTAIGAVVAVTGCGQVPGYASLPVAVKLPSGERLEGGAAIRVLSGAFQATDGRKTCSGSFHLAGLGRPASLFVTCSDGVRVTSSSLDLSAFSGTGTLSFDRDGIGTFRYGDAVR